MISKKIHRYFGAFCAAALVLAGTLASGEEPNRHLLIIIDGMRPDYVTQEHAPNLHALGERGVFGEAHTAVFPTYTRPNAASVGSGSYPQTHGLIQNTMHHPDLGEFSAGTASNLRRFDEATGGQLITTISLGEVLDDAGLQLFVTGSGGSGNTLLQNPRGAGKGIWQAGGLFIPESAREEAIEAVGELPGTRSSSEGTEWAVRSYLHHALGDAPPHVTLMWLGETDSAGHRHGVGAPETLEAVASVDRNIGRIVAAHEEHGLTDKVNIYVTADHGFSTTTGGFNVGRILSDAGIEEEGLLIVRNMVWVEEGDDARLAEVAEALQRHEAVGNVYTRPAEPGGRLGKAPGTLSTDLVHWNHARSADLIASPAWTDEVNEFGFAGTTTFGGTATHGSDSPFDLRIRLVAAGPDIKQGVRSTVPTNNVDFAPTMLHLLGVTPPDSMDGRVLQELLREGPAPEEVLVEHDTVQAEHAFGDGLVYRARMDISETAGHDGQRRHYLRGAHTERREAE